MASEGDNSFEALALPHLEAAYLLARRLSRQQEVACSSYNSETWVDLMDRLFS